MTTTTLVMWCSARTRAGLPSSSTHHRRALAATSRPASSCCPSTTRRSRRPPVSPCRPTLSPVRRFLAADEVVGIRTQRPPSACWRHGTTNIGRGRTPAMSRYDGWPWRVSWRCVRYRNGCQTSDAWTAILDVVIVLRTTPSRERAIPTPRQLRRVLSDLFLRWHYSSSFASCFPHIIHVTRMPLQLQRFWTVSFCNLFVLFSIVYCIKFFIKRFSRLSVYISSRVVPSQSAIVSHYIAMKFKSSK